MLQVQHRNFGEETSFVCLWGRGMDQDCVEVVEVVQARRKQNGRSRERITGGLEEKEWRILKNPQKRSL
jgi:hypothetical protein